MTRLMHKIASMGLPILIVFGLLPHLVKAQVAPSALEQKDGLMYQVGEAEPFTGQVAAEGQMKGQYKAGLRVGHWEGMYPSGKTQWTSDYNDAGQMLAHTMYHSNGQKRFEGNFSDGRPAGVHTAWDETGGLASETPYQNGARHGTHKIWANGALSYSAEFVNGDRDGATIWWYADGGKKWATYYQKGKRSGVWTQWHKDGRILAQSEWKNGMLTERHSP